MGSQRQGLSAEARATRSAMIAHARAGMDERGFRYEGEREDVAWWRRALPGLPGVWERYGLCLAPADGGLDAAVVGGAELDGDALRRVAPADVALLWLQMFTRPQTPTLLSLGMHLQERFRGRSMVGVDPDRATALVDEMLFATVDAYAPRALASLLADGGVERCALAPSADGAPGFGAVRSGVVALAMAGRRDVAEDLIARYEAGPRSAAEAEHPDSWPAFTRWVRSLSAEGWEGLASA